MTKCIRGWFPVEWYKTKWSLILLPQFHLGFLWRSSKNLENKFTKSKWDIMNVKSMCDKLLHAMETQLWAAKSIPGWKAEGWDWRWDGSAVTMREVDVFKGKCGQTEGIKRRKDWMKGSQWDAKLVRNCEEMGAGCVYKWRRAWREIKTMPSQRLGDCTAMQYEMQSIGKACKWNKGII